MGFSGDENWMERTLPCPGNECIQFLAHLRRVGRSMPRTFDEHPAALKPTTPRRVNVTHHHLVQIKNGVGIDVTLFCRVSLDFFYRRVMISGFVNLAQGLALPGASFSSTTSCVSRRESVLPSIAFEE